MSASVNDTTGRPDLTTTHSTTEKRAYKSPAAWLRFLLPAALGVTADLALKSWAFPDGINSGRHPAFSDNPPLAIIPNILGFTTTVNQGAVFGIGQGKVTLFLIFSLFALAIIIWVFLSSWRSQWLTHFALGLITAGAIGNLYDRAVFHGVRDMLQFYVHWYPYIFNIADVLLCVGVPLLMVRWLFFKDPSRPEPSSGFEVEIRK